MTTGMLAWEQKRIPFTRSHVFTEEVKQRVHTTQWYALPERKNARNPVYVFSSDYVVNKQRLNFNSSKRDGCIPRKEGVYEH